MSKRRIRYTFYVQYEGVDMNKAYRKIRPLYKYITRYFNEKSPIKLYIIDDIGEFYYVTGYTNIIDTLKFMQSQEKNVGRRDLDGE